MVQKIDFSGKWLFRHWYPTTDDAAEESAEYEMDAQQNGDHIVFQSVEDDGKDAYMLVRLNIDGNVATGSWHEDAHQHGPFEGAQYSGAGQLIITDDGGSMEGVWAGAGLDRAAGKPRIYTGRWEFKKL